MSESVHAVCGSHLGEEEKKNENKKETPPERLELSTSRFASYACLTVERASQLRHGDLLAEKGRIILRHILKYF